MNDNVAYSLAEALLFLINFAAKLTLGGVAAWALALTYALWIFFLAVMNLSRAQQSGEGQPSRLPGT